MSESSLWDGAEVSIVSVNEHLSLQSLEINTTAPMLHFEDIEDFRKRSNNFPRFFNCQNIGGLPQKLIQERPVFRRFQMLFPFQTYFLEELTTLVSWYENSQTWQELYDAYTTMALLVDTNDPHVIRDGSIDEFYLIR